MELINIISQYLQENGINHKTTWVDKVPPHNQPRGRDWWFARCGVEDTATDYGYISIPNTDLLIIIQEQSQFYITGSGRIPPDWPRYNLADPEALPAALHYIQTNGGHVTNHPTNHPG